MAGSSISSGLFALLPTAVLIGGGNRKAIQCGNFRCTLSPRERRQNFSSGTGQSSTGQSSTGQSSTGQSSTGQSSTEERESLHALMGKVMDPSYGANLDRGPNAGAWICRHCDTTACGRTEVTAPPRNSATAYLKSQSARA
jgi:hypothetical protein